MDPIKLQLDSLAGRENATRKTCFSPSLVFNSAAALQCLSNSIFSLLLLSLDGESGNSSQLEMSLKHLLTEKLANDLDAEALPKIVELASTFM